MLRAVVAATPQEESTRQFSSSSLGPVLLLVLVLCSGCADSSSTNDAGVGGRADLGSASTDAGQQVADTGPRATDSGAQGTDAAAAGDVARCTATAAMVATACAGQADRTCEHIQGGMRCATERADVLADAYQCLLDASTGSCRTFSDPSGASACLQALGSRTMVTATAEAVVSRILTLCPEGTTRPQLLTGGVMPVIAMSGATLARLDACLGPAATCAAAVACVNTEFASIVACYP
jgi:hypothetical protein